MIHLTSCLWESSKRSDRSATARWNRLLTETVDEGMTGCEALRIVDHQMVQNSERRAVVPICGSLRARCRLARFWLSSAILCWAVAIFPSGHQQARAAGTPSQIEGTVVDVSSGTAISGVRVTASGPGADPAAFTDASGHYVIKDLPPGVYSVFPRKEGYGKLTSAAPHRVRVLAGGVVPDVNFRLHKSAAISGRVLDYNTKMPVPGMRVGVWAKGFAYGRPLAAFEGNAYTDAQGSYRIADLQEGTYYVGATPRIMQPVIRNVRLPRPWILDQRATQEPSIPTSPLSNTQCRYNCRRNKRRPEWTCS